MIQLPTHTQLRLPLLQVLQENGRLCPHDAADLVAAKLRLSPEVRSAVIPMPGYSKRGVNLLERRLRWVKQTEVRRGFVVSAEKARWELTPQGTKFCQDARPGLILTVFETRQGVALWAEFQSAMGVLEDGALQAVITSSPFPVVGGRPYGRLTPDACIAMLEEMFVGLKRLVKQDGSVVMNLADVWEEGRPTRSLYQEELLIKLVKEQGWFLCDRFSWHNPSKPACTDWVTKSRERVRSSMETFYWLSQTPHPYADNRQVLVPYGETMTRTLARGGDSRPPRPSGHGHMGASYTKNNGGAIPPNFFHVANSSSNNAYQRYCRRMRLPVHPARFPEDGVLDFFIKVLTRAGDAVADLFGGSLLLPEVAERLGRRWFACDRHLPYLRGGEGRFTGVEGFHSFAIPGEPRLVLPLP